MPWNKQGGGGGPWDNGGNGGPWGSGGRGRRGVGQPPDLEELLRKSQERFRKLIPGGFGDRRTIGLIVLALLVVWGLTGFYKVDSDELGVVLRFGRFVGYTEPGLNYHLPAPIESEMTPAVTRINRLESGLSGIVEGRRAMQNRDGSIENLMLTGDENIVDISYSVFWRIKDAEKYLFNIKDPDGTVRMVAESAVREIIGTLPIRAALFEDRQAIADRTLTRMNELLDSYGAGIVVTQVQMLKADPPPEVIDAFNDVQRAKADQERFRNEAEAYRNDIIPRARGDSERIVQEAEAYKEQITDVAQGEAKRFTSVYQGYKAAPEIIARRLYIEMVEDVLKGAQKVIVDPTAKGVVPYLPLPQLGSLPAGAGPVKPVPSAGSGSSK